VQPEDHLLTLNQEQKAAVTHTEGPLLIIAGAGAGKTKVITHRILHLIETGVAPEQILAVTFTNKAAREMLGRVEELLKGARISHGFPGLPFIATFHALGVYLLRTFHKEAGLPRHFTIYDRSDSLALIREAMKNVGISKEEKEPRMFLSALSKHKGNGTSLQVFRDDTGHNYFSRLLLPVWSEYEKLLAREKALDFDDLLLKALELLKQNLEVLTACRKKWTHLHIDEYQDTNRVQYLLARLLAGEHENLCVVGDIDQTIYSWRGADIEHLLSFTKTYPGARLVTLTENYRSTGTILHAANTIIEKNVRRHPKVLTTKNAHGEKILLAGLYDENEEARYVAAQAQALMEQGIAPRDIAVLYRANFQSRVLEEAFLARNLPYQVLGVRFFERKEVKDLLSYIRSALNPQSIADLKRIANSPPRGIGKVTLLKMLEGKADTLSGKAREAVLSLYAILKDIREAIETRTASEVVRFALKRSGMETELTGGDEEMLERLENVKELVTLALRYDTLPAESGILKLLEDAALTSDQDELKENRDATRLMTVHSAKGLEFNTVFIVGLEDGLFPHEGIPGEDRDNEEERRLFYVALTRARRKLFLTFGATRTIYGRHEVTSPSPFIMDIDETIIETDSDAHARAEPVISLL
jgi:DNA helicase II / ATP-dependent DNA helicase PcrA